LLDATSEKRGDVLEDVVEEMFLARKVPYLGTGSDLLPTEPLDPLYEEFDVGLDAPDIDALGIRSSIEGVVIVWHVGNRQSRGLAAKHGDRSCQNRVDDRLR
jgi:hypothetical protein